MLLPDAPPGPEAPPRPEASARPEPGAAPRPQTSGRRRAHRSGAIRRPAARLAGALLASALLAPAPAGAFGGDAAGGPADAPDGWQLAARDPQQGWRLYRRDEPDSSFPRYRLESRIDATPDQVLEAAIRKVVDVRYVAANQRRTVLRSGPDEVLNRLELDVPFIADRDVVTRTRWSRSGRDDAGEVLRVFWEPVVDGAPPVPPGVVRMRSRGFWEFRPAPGGGTAVVYEQHADLGSAVPRWLIASRMNDEIVNELRMLRRIVAAGPPAVAAPPKVSAAPLRDPLASPPATGMQPQRPALVGEERAAGR